MLSAGLHTNSRFPGNLVKYICQTMRTTTGGPPPYAALLLLLANCPETDRPSSRPAANSCVYFVVGLQGLLLTACQHSFELANSPLKCRGVSESRCGEPLVCWGAGCTLLGLLVTGHGNTIIVYHPATSSSHHTNIVR